MKVTEAFQGNFIDALCVHDKDATLEITSVDDRGTVKDSTKKLIDKPIVRFKGTDKGLILNKTNARTIGFHHGNEMNDWPGKSITIYATTCDSFGEIVPCVRVRPIKLKKA